MIESIAIEMAREQHKDRLREAEKARLINQARSSNTHHRPEWLNLKQILSLSLSIK